MTSGSTASQRKKIAGFGWGTVIGSLGGLIGLGGAEFRLPVLVGCFRLPTLQAVILNKAMSLVVVTSALVFRTAAISFDQLWPHADVVANLLAGSLIGAWWAAGHAMRLSSLWLNRIIMVLLVGLALLLLGESVFGHVGSALPLFETGATRWLIGFVAGFGIGVVAALLGVAGGELLIPTIVLLYGIDIKLAGSLSLMVSLPTMIVSFARYSQSNAFVILRQERALLGWMAAGSIVGAAAGGILLGIIPANLLLAGLGIILLVSAVKVFQHAH
jgi:uncharacterized protein